ncbi:MAG: hypothetical protein Q8Q23_02450 [bacterium]|nr:hypothetical protein [bacterium]
MLIWFAILIPVVVIPFLKLFFPRRIVWWEIFVPLVVSLVLIALCKFSSVAVQTADTEYWGGWLTDAKYFESWDERVSCRHTKYRSETYTDGEGRIQIRQVPDGHQHFYDVDDHPADWEASDSNGAVIRITYERFEELCRRFGNRTFVDLRRNYHFNDGDMYLTTWDRREETLVPVVSKHFYENRVQAQTAGEFSFPAVDPKAFGLFEYPDITNTYECPSVLGDAGPLSADACRQLDVINAEYGKKYQIRVWVLIFRNKSSEAGTAQKNYWKGGNKNELVITVGVNDNHEVQWSQTFSWTDRKNFVSEANSFVANQEGDQLDLKSVAGMLKEKIPGRWQRKEFAAFSYLTVEPSAWMIVMTFILVGLATFGTAYWTVKNNIN